MKLFTFIIFIILIISGDLISKEKSQVKLSKTTATSDVWLNANRMNGIFRNNGIWYYDNVAGNWGLEWPKGSHNSPIFAGGQWIGAVVDGEIKIAGVQHSATEFQAGEILSPGVASNPADPSYKWYEIRPNGVGDWGNWPFNQGAPYVDENDNGQYDFGEAPQLIGDQTIFSVWNDLAPHNEYVTNPLGVEVRQTAFAFNRADAIGDMQFIKWQMVNKSGEDWDSTYFSIWLDPDLGGASDDLVGCDTTLGLAFTYNADNDDATYGIPPAQGIDFFQGPIIDKPGSSVNLPNGTVLTDKKMLGMTSFVFYNNTSDPTNGNPDSGQDVWNFMRGIWRDGQPITYGARGTNPLNPPTKFMFPGDPETEQGSGSGWLDSEADDRRFLMTTGPFEMPAWDDINGNGMPDFGEPGVQEIVVGIIMAQGSDNLNSVTALKEVDQLSQLAYDLNFNVVEGPRAADLVSGSLPNKIVLSWDDRSEYNQDGSPLSNIDPFVDRVMGDTVIIYNVITVIDDNDYNFYGYSLYQHSDASGSNPVKIAHWDVGKISQPTQYNSPRSFEVLYNHNPVVDSYRAPIENGKLYYFSIHAESYLEFGTPQIISRPSSIKAFYALGGESGFDYNPAITDADTAAHISGNSQGRVSLNIIDPTKMTGSTYQVQFEYVGQDLVWDLVDITKDSIVINNSDIYSLNAGPTADGIQINISNPPTGIDVTNNGGWDYQGNRWISGTNWGAPSGALFGGLDNGANFFGSDLDGGDYVEVNMEWAGVTNRGSDESAVALAALSMAEYPERWSKAVVYRRDLGYTVQPTLGDIPVAVYDVWADPPRRLKIAFVEDANNGSGNLLWDMGWNGSAFATTGGREYLFILNDDYDENYTDYLNSTLDGTYNNSMYAIYPASRSREYLIDPFELQIFASRANTPDDVFEYSTSAPIAYTSTKGDLNGDEGVNISDVIVLINGIVKIVDLTGEQEFAADFNNDLKINVVDVVSIINDILDLNKTSTNNSSISSGPSNEKVQLALKKPLIDEDRSITIPLDLTGASFRALQFSMTYDPKIIEPGYIASNNSSVRTSFHAEKGIATYLIYTLNNKDISANDLPQIQIRKLSDKNADIIVDELIASDGNGNSLITEIVNGKTSTGEIPHRFALHQNYPNPFNSTTVIEFDLAKTSDVSLIIYNTLGQRVKNLIQNKTMDAGSHSYSWKGDNNFGIGLSSGIYFMELKTKSRTFHKKMVLIK